MNTKYLMVFAAGIGLGAMFKNLLIFAVILFLLGFAGWTYFKAKSGSLVPGFLKKNES